MIFSLESKYTQNSKVRVIGFDLAGVCEDYVFESFCFISSTARWLHFLEIFEDVCYMWEYIYVHIL